MNKGGLFIVSGPSGAGKSTVLSELFKIIDNYYFSISATTRAPRPGEQEGVNYYYKSKEEFEKMIENAELLEYAQYVGNFYGTPEAPVTENSEAGIDVFFDIETSGAMQIKAKKPEAVSVFIFPPSFEELERRLRNRSTETEEKIAERLETAKKELALAEKYDYIVINDDLNVAVNELKAIITAEKCKSQNRINLLINNEE